MTFKNLVNHAIELKYKVVPQENFSKVILEINNAIEIELSFPDDNIEFFLNDSVNIDWEYSIVNKLNGEKIHSEWFDYYKGTTEIKLQDMKKDIWEFMDNFAKKKFRIVEKSVFSLFGRKFLKFKELEFE
ncbi:hypothetical protein [Kaistella faecalis]|uniref:hypothetical protein n=1 Tax=Kaistella faecalis TaxID=2852098 RepID=UPI001C47D403|nr:hypothetical protein [Chryseobacterium faecale]UFK97831.1 hypothetical protein LL667_00415 [Chryseobacterium faecale]